MVAGFVSPLALHLGKFWMPLPLKLAKDAGIDAPMEFVTTSSSIAKPFAVGLIELTVGQFNNLNARNDLWIVDAAQRKTQLVRDLSAVVRNKLSTIMSDNGVVTGIVGTDTIQVAFDKLIQAISPRTLADVINQFNVNRGTSHEP